MKTLLLIVGLSIPVSYQSFGQTVDKELIEIIGKNIISYHIRYSLNHDLGLKYNAILNNERYFFTRMMPDCNYNLSIKVYDSKFNYPDSTYKIFEFVKIGFQMQSDSTGNSWSTNSFLADDNYLAAINPLTKKIKFLSGNFFISPFSSDFRLNEKVPLSFISYLKIRSNHWQPENISFLKSNRKKLCFIAISKLFNKEILISVNRNDFNEIDINFRGKHIIY